MQATQFKYPVFEANQVLTSAHLNQGYNYLDEQERLTRANLIGIGIVCGLEIRLEAAAATIHLTKGCGISSEGYLILEPQDVALTLYRKYTLPPDLPYPVFHYRDPVTNEDTPYDLWELFPAGEPGTTALNNPANFLHDKAVMLFLELRKEGLRNCSPNNCNDKGAEVTATVRRLLIRVQDLVKLLAREHELPGSSTPADLEGLLSARLNLPELRLPRYDVPNTGPATSQQVLAAYFTTLSQARLVPGIQAALTAAYQAFRPVLADLYPQDPFRNFSASFAFFDQAVANPSLPTPAQVRFLQYYYDLFDDLLKAYGDICRQGVELLCACCPDADLFPRHLHLGLLDATQVPDAAIYRHRFLPSAATSNCGEKTRELVALCQRLVEMIAQFTVEPPLPALPANALTDAQIRITPSQLADVPVAGKAIPYYYRQSGSPPLYRVWDPVKTRRRRAHLNLSYRAEEFLPAAPPFVRQPLQYDLEPHNFLRIEGHLGKDYRSVLRTLLSLKTQYRLPIDIIALRTGAFDEKTAADLSVEEATFQDLETLYDVTRERLQSALTEGVMYFYGVPIPDNTDPGGTPKLPLLKRYAPNFRHLPGTVGAWYEKYLTQLQDIPYIDVDQNKIDANAVLLVYCVLFANTNPPPPPFYPHVVSIYYLSKLSEILPATLSELGFADFENKYQDLVGLARYFRSEEVKKVPTALASFIPSEELIDQFDQVLFTSALEPVRAIREEYNRRLKEARQKQFFSHFLQKHPGIQHKAGVPLGGTFILVYHDNPDKLRVRPEFDTLFDFSRLPFAARNLPFTARSSAISSQPQVSTGTTQALGEAFTRISAKPQLARDPDIRLLLGTFTGFVPNLDLAPAPAPQDAVDEVIDKTVAALTDGAVIADFFLPYLCCGGGAAVQFVLPKPPLGFAIRIGCTKAGDEAEITITPQGGVEPYSLKVGDQGFQSLHLVKLLKAGSHQLTLKDGEGTESQPQMVVIPQQLVLEQPEFFCAQEGNVYTARIAVRGGTPPYTASRGTVAQDPESGTYRYTSEPLPGNEDISIEVTDSRQCSANATLNHSCLAELAFTATVGCTNADEQAPVQLTASGGTSPYQVQVGDAEPQPLPASGTLPLPAGSHTLVVIDEAGSRTPAQTVVVPPALTLGNPSFDCIGQNNEYIAVFPVSGGVPPYAVQRGTVSPQNDGTFLYQSDNLPGNQDTAIIVSDSRGCFAARTLNHCCLPCEGQSRRGGYRLWLQAPAGAPYEAYRPASAVRLRYNGEDLEMGGGQGLLQIEQAELNGNFEAAMAAAVERLNKAVSQALARRYGPQLGPRLLTLAYAPEPRDPFGLLRIEHMACDTFNLEFDYTVAQPTPTFTLTMRYTNEGDVAGAGFNGALLFNRRAERITPIPAFDLGERNQCAGGDYVRLCEGPDPQVTFNFDGTGNNRFVFTGKVTNMEPGEIAAWVWDMPQAQPTEPFYQGESIEAVLLKPGGLVRLTAITQKGCFGIIDRELHL